MGAILHTVSVYSVLLPFLTGLLLWKLQDANAKIMVVLLAFASFSQTGADYLPVEQNIRYNLYTIVDALFWSLLFFKNTLTKFARALILILFLLFIFAAIFTFSIRGIEKDFYSFLVCFDSAIQVICVLIYFYEKNNNENIIRLIEDSMFWFCMAILFYAPCTYFLFVYRSVQGKVPSELWTYHHVLNTILYLLITVGFLIKVKRFKRFLQWI